MESVSDYLRETAALMRREAAEPHVIAIVKRRTMCGAKVHHGPDGPWHRDPAHPKWCNAQPGGATQPSPDDHQRTRAFHRAVADSLDTAGADLWAHGPLCCEGEHGCNECDGILWMQHVRRALAVARAYRGEGRG